MRKRTGWRIGAVDDAAVRAYNDALLALARELVTINYTRKGRFRTEPAVRGAGIAGSGAGAGY